MWTVVKSQAIGGLLEIGFFEDSDYLMVLSSQGRGIIDCFENKRVARDHDDYYFSSWNAKTGIVQGIGTFRKQQVICGGFEHPNVLLKETEDGWRYKIETLEQQFWFSKTKKIQRIVVYNEELKLRVEIDATGQVLNRGIGFSNTGNTFVFASASDVHFINRRDLMG